MKILLADALDTLAAKRLGDAGHEVIEAPGATAETLPELLGDAEVLVVRSTKVTAEAIAAAPRLALIIRAGAGTNTIALDDASGRGVSVCNLPGRNAIAVAELAMGLLLASDRRIADATAALRAGEWDKASFSKAEGLAGQKMAILGVGSIGLATAKRARTFDIVVRALRKPDRSPDTEAEIRKAGVKLVDTMEELLGAADIVSLHLPYGDDTKQLVDAAFLQMMKDGATLLNTSRGELVDEAALIDALDNRGMRAGLDVWCDEPGTSSGPFVSALAQHPSVVGTHHIGASTDQAQRSVATGVVEVVESYVQGDLISCVNLEGDVEGTTIAVRHLDQVGALAAVLTVLRAEGLNVSQMQNRPFAGRRAAVATIRVDGEIGDGCIEALEAIDAVLAVRR